MTYKIDRPHKQIRDQLWDKLTTYTRNYHHPELRGLGKEIYQIFRSQTTSELYEKTAKNLANIIITHK